MTRRRPRPTAGRATDSVAGTVGSGLWSAYRPLLRGHEWSIGGITLASFGSGFAEAGVLVMIATIAVGIGEGDGDALVASVGPLDLDLSTDVAFLAALGLLVVRVAFALAAAHLAARMTARITAQVRAGTFADFAAASWAEQSRRPESEIHDLLVRHVGKATSSVGTITQATASACTVLALVVSAALVDPASALLLVVVGGVLFAAIRPFGRWAKRLASAQIVAGREYSRLSLQALAMSLEMRSFGVTEEVSDQLERATSEEVRPVSRAEFLKHVVTAVYQTATVLVVLAGLFAVHLASDRPLASLGATVVILIRSLNQAAGLQGAYHALSENEPFVRGLASDRARMRASGPTSGDVEVLHPEALRFDRVSYSYGGSQMALTDVDFEVARGEVVGIIGPSGSGKSTLIQLLLRLREPTGGRYLLDDVDAAEVDDESWFSNVAFVAQESHLIDDTLAANIAFFRVATRDEVVAAARRAHIHDEIAAMPDGYDTRLGSRGGALSGGQRQRVSIARALLRDPAILVLDEPTSALDMRSEALVHDTFTELKGKVTTFVIAHRLSTLNSCDRIMVMGEGRLQAFGPREALQRDSDFYRDALALSRIRTDTDDDG